jgi:tetratricopeptide (TPR) repeat protein
VKRKHLIAQLILVGTLIATQSICCSTVGQSTSPKKPTSNNEKLASEFLEKAGNNFESNDISAAIRDANKAIELNPRLSKAFYLRACCRHVRNDFAGAFQDANYSILLDPNSNPIYYFQRGMASYRLRKFEACIQDCSVTIKRAPDFSGAYLYRGHSRLELGDRKGAITDCDAALRLSPTDDSILRFKLRLSSGL